MFNLPNPDEFRALLSWKTIIPPFDVSISRHPVAEALIDGIYLSEGEPGAKRFKYRSISGINSLDQNACEPAIPGECSKINIFSP